MLIYASFAGNVGYEGSEQGTGLGVLWPRALLSLEEQGDSRKAGKAGR